MNRHIRPTITVITFAVFAAVRPSLGEVPSTAPPWIATGKTMMVATDHPQASQVGLDILRDGGNAIDAAIAVSFALGVTRPQSTGLGGGGFLIARMSDGTIHVFDYRETAPLSSTPDMFEKITRDNPNKAPPSRCGYLAPAVPGLLAGLYEIHDQLGTVPMNMLIAPATTLAGEGVAVDAHYVNATKTIGRLYAKYPELKQSCPYVYRVHLRSGNPREVGDKLVQPELARFLAMIARVGKAAFYDGPISELIAKEMRKRGGIITEKDLKEYRVVRRKPLVSSYRGHELITMPPPSSGGVCLIETLNMLESYDLKTIHRSDSALAIHYQIEAMKRAFSDRAQYLADADFVDVPIQRLISASHAQQLAKQIEDRATPVVNPRNTTQLPTDDGTSHYCIVDRWGNWVVATETINTSFGSLAAIGAIGVILNNEMDDFTAERGKTNAFDLVQSNRNAVEPRKRPLSSMTPTIILKNNRPVLALGGSGGPRIISSVLNVILNVLDYDMPLAEAIRATRIHHQWMPDHVITDRELDSATKKSITQRGHAVAPTHKTGIVQAIQWTQDGLVGVSDPRKHGEPRGE